MYSSKELNKNIAKSYLSQGDPYREPSTTGFKYSRHKGKQFTTVPSKNTCNGGGYFQKTTYASDPLQDNTMYVKTQPVDKRKLGFGTRDAHRRDEFMSHIRTEQYRETLTREMDIVEKQKDDARHDNDLDAELLMTTKGFPKGLKETKYLYEIGRSNVTEFNQKSHRDTFYTMHKGNSSFTRNNGPFVLSSEGIGAGTDTVEYKPPKPKMASTRQFYDKSHLHV